MNRILILCTGNACRSQMAEGVLRALDPALEVHSAGTDPADQVHPLAVRVMSEVGIDISQNLPKGVEPFLPTPFDHVITVCDEANETCPLFTGQVRHREHIGFEDPARATGSPEEVLNVFRDVRDRIRDRFTAWYDRHFPPAS